VALSANVVGTKTNILRCGWGEGWVRSGQVGAVSGRCVRVWIVGNVVRFVEKGGDFCVFVCPWVVVLTTKGGWRRRYRCNLRRCHTGTFSVNLFYNFTIFFNFPANCRFSSQTIMIVSVLKP